MMKDEPFMRQALALAAQAKGATLPNPMVGALVVQGGRIVGRGFHRRAGQPHAEVLALAEAGKRARGGTLYVTLEPCDHVGRTPPCTKAILASGVRRVVAAMQDPNPLNRGRGFRRLRRQGLQVSVGLLARQARVLNRSFVTRMRKGRPFVTVKMAQSLDGKIATSGGHSRWISGPPARAWVQRLRRGVDAILVGVETVLRDDPRLTVRGRGQGKRDRGKGGGPVRVVLDSRLRTPAKARLFSSKGPVWIATLAGACRFRERRLVRAGAQVLRLPGRMGRVRLDALLRQLLARGIDHLLIEGGAEVVASAFEARAVDRIAWVVAPQLIGGRDAPGAVGGQGISNLRQAVRLEGVRVRWLGGDLLVTGEARFPGRRHRGAVARARRRIVDGGW